MTNKLTMGSLFDGVAMFPLAAERNGIKAVWASEIEKFPIAVSKHHFPDMKHLGDVCIINGAEIEPVDIITFGSPCQNLSVAGKRAGLAGEQSGLFSQAIRIIREMRVATNGEYPKYCIWENVFGAFSSNKGQDFLQVLQELAETEIPIPRSDKNGKIIWSNAGVVRTNDREISYRLLDGQYWGVAQRRKRIFLVTSFGKKCAGEILLIEKSLPWYFAESGETREGVAGSAGDGVKGTEYLTGWDCQEKRIFTDRGVAPTISGSGGGSGGRTMAGYLAQTITFRDTAGTLRANAGAPKHESDWEKLVVHPKVAGTLCSSGAGMNRPAGQGNETDLVFVIQSATMSGEKKQNGLGVSDGPCYTLDCRADHAVAHAVDVRNLYETEELSGTLQSKQTGGYSLNYQNPVRVGYAVRRLMPIETERLMSMPDNWTNIPGASDTARYKAIGNSLVMNIAEWIFSQIVNIEKENPNAK